VDPFAVLVGLFLCVALAAGGSSTSEAPTAIVRLCAIPVLAIAAWKLAVRPVPRDARWPLAILIGAAALTFAQLIPLPPEVWRALPGRQAAVDGFVAARMSLPWLPISLTPEETWDAALGLIPPAAMFCAAVCVSERARKGLPALVLAMAAGSVLLAMAQRLAGPDSRVWLYAFANRDTPAGLFANRNHQAALLATTLPFAAWVGEEACGRIPVCEGIEPDPAVRSGQPLRHGQ
jgi:hypothetical protein